jgi:hypothetical protein
MIETLIVLAEKGKQQVMCMNGRVSGRIIFSTECATNIVGPILKLTVPHTIPEGM